MNEEIEGDARDASVDESAAQRGGEVGDAERVKCRGFCGSERLTERMIAGLHWGDLTYAQTTKGTRDMASMAASVARVMVPVQGDPPLSP